MTRARIVFDPLNNDQKIIIICISCTHSAVQDPFLSPNDPLNNVIKRQSGPVNIIRIWERPFNKQKNLSRFIASVAKENEWILFLIAMSRSIVSPIARFCFALIQASVVQKPASPVRYSKFERQRACMANWVLTHWAKKKIWARDRQSGLCFAGQSTSNNKNKRGKKQTAKLRILIKIDFNYRPRFDGK